MGRRIVYSEGTDQAEEIWVELPDEWLGKHADIRDDIVQKNRELADKALGDTLLKFSICMGILDDWSLPGLSGNKAKWDFSQIDLRTIAWVNMVVFNDFLQCFFFQGAG